MRTFSAKSSLLCTDGLSRLSACNLVEALLSQPRKPNVTSDSSRLLLPNPSIYLGDPYDTPATPLSRPGSNTKLSDCPSTQPLGETFVILHQYCIIFSQPTLYHIYKRRQHNRVFTVVATTGRTWLAVDSPLPVESTHFMSVSSDICIIRVAEMEVSRFISLHAVKNIPERLRFLSFRQLRKVSLAWNERLRARLQITQLQELKWSTRTMQVTRLSTAACRSVCPLTP